MKEDGMKKTRKILISILLILAVSAGIALKFYLKPDNKYITTTLCSLDGKKVKVVFEVTWRRHLLTPATLEGMIAVDRSVYRGRVSDSRGFTEQIGAKFRGDAEIPHFVIWPQQSGEDAFEDYVWLPYAGSGSDTDSFKRICLFVAKDDTLYYGPAENAEEARAVMEQLVNGR